MLILFLGGFGILIYIDNNNEIKEVFHSIKAFVKCVFMYQVLVWGLTNENLNKVGVIILELITTLAFWSMNVIIFFALCAIFIIRLITFGLYRIYMCIRFVIVLIALGYYKIFKKR